MSGKKRDQNVFVISSTKLGRFWWNFVHSFLNKSAAKICKVFHLTWIMSLHYLVKLEIFITQVLPLRCQIQELQILSHLNYGIQIRQIWIRLITACGNTAKEASLIWMNWNIDWEWSEPSWITSSLAAAAMHSSVASSTAADQSCMCLATWGSPTPRSH